MSYYLVVQVVLVSTRTIRAWWINHATNGFRPNCEVGRKMVAIMRNIAFGAAAASVKGFDQIFSLEDTRARRRGDDREKPGLFVNPQTRER